MKQLLLLRHGASVANEQKRCCGWTDSPLAEAGLDALREKRERFRYPSLRGFAVYTSDLCRTGQTLRALYGDVAYTPDPAFREMNFGDFENRTSDELQRDPAFQAWLREDNWQNVCPNGESGAQLTVRVLRRLEQLMAEHTRLCLVTHGGVIAALMAHYFPAEDKRFAQWQPKNGCGYLLQLGAEPSYVAAPFEKPAWQTGAYSFCQNRACEYFPCHKGIDAAQFNCLFCYCPLYPLGERCGGDFTYTASGVKDCANCLLPHRRESYDYVNRRFSELADLAARNGKDPD